MMRLFASEGTLAAARTACGLRLCRWTSVGTCRGIVGIALMVHFAQRAVQAFTRHSGQQGTLAAACVLLSALLAFGVATGVAAVAVNVLAVASSRLAYAPTLNDYVASVAPLALALAASSSRQPRDAEGDGSGFGLLLVCAAVVAVNVGGGPFAFFVDTSRGPAWVRWAFRAMAVALVAPTNVLRTGGAIGQLCLHGVLFAIGPYRLTHVIFGATSLLFMGPRAGGARRFELDLPSILCMSVFAIAGCAYAGACLGRDVSRSVRVLAAVGLLPLPPETLTPDGSW